MRKLGLLFFLFLTCHHFTFSQQGNCECASFFSPLASADFESFFDPSVIRSKRITEVRIYTVSGQKNNKSKTDTSLRISEQRSIGELYTFNKDGYAIHNRTFSQGKQNHSCIYNRNSNNGIVQSISQFFDSAGRISADLKSEITDYTVDEDGNILKSKKRDFNGMVLPDERSEYTVTEYNKQGWKTKETTHYYWDWDTPPHNFNTTYSTYTNNGKTETAKTYEGKKLFLTTTTTYDDMGAPLSISSFNHFMNKTAYKKIFKYDSKGKLIKYIQSSGGGGGSECPHKGDFSNEFKYNSDGLLIEQRHSFANTICILQFEYR